VLDRRRIVTEAQEALADVDVSVTAKMRSLPVGASE